MSNPETKKLHPNVGEGRVDDGSGQQNIINSFEWFNDTSPDDTKYMSKKRKKKELK